MDKLYIDEKEVLRYLGYKGQELKENDRKYLDEAMSKALEVANPKYIYRKFDITLTDDEVLVNDTNLVLQGKDIYEHLKDCNAIYLMACTIGTGFDRQITIEQIKNMAVSLYLESCGSTLIENLCDQVNDEIDAIEKDNGYNTNWRFSCGYGDLPMDIQGTILDVLNARKTIGITCTDTNIMIPRKSVTAIIGVMENEKSEKTAACDICNLRENCVLRKEGRYCGKN